jgi:Flp pilus assembly protein TadG
MERGLNAKPARTHSPNSWWISIGKRLIGGMNMKLSHSLKYNNLRGNQRHAVTRRVGSAPSQRGQAMIELALILPILLLLTIGVIEFGRVAYFSIEVADAARAGAQYGTQSLADAANNGNITQAALNNAPDIGPGLLTVNPPLLSCVCPGTGSVTGALCAGPLGCSYPLVYLTVTTTYPLSTLFQYPGIPTTFNLTGASTMPVQRQ